MQPFVRKGAYSSRLGSGKIKWEKGKMWGKGEAGQPSIKRSINLRRHRSFSRTFRDLLDVFF